MVSLAQEVLCPLRWGRSLLTKKTQLTIIHPDYPNFPSNMENLYRGMLEQVSLKQVLKISMVTLAPRFAEGNVLFFATTELAAEWEEA